MPVPDDTQSAHLAAHQIVNDPTTSPATREWLMIGHLTEDHGQDQFTDLPSDPDARARLHDDLHRDDDDDGHPDHPVLQHEKDILALVESVHSQMESGDPTYHSGQAMALVTMLWSRIIDTDTPATVITAVAAANRMLTDALGRLTALDPETSVRLATTVLEGVNDALAPIRESGHTRPPLPHDPASGWEDRD